MKDVQTVINFDWNNITAINILLFRKPIRSKIHSQHCQDAHTCKRKWCESKQTLNTNTLVNKRTATNQDKGKPTQHPLDHLGLVVRFQLPPPSVSKSVGISSLIMQRNNQNHKVICRNVFFQLPITFSHRKIRLLSTEKASCYCLATHSLVPLALNFTESEWPNWRWLSDRVRDAQQFNDKNMSTTSEVSCHTDREKKINLQKQPAVFSSVACENSE